MTYITITIPSCFSHATNFDVSADIIDDLSQLKFDGESGTYLLIYAVSFMGFCVRDEVPSDDIACMLFAFTFEGRIKQWCHTLRTTSI